jgi:hypothetical protein
MNCTKGVNPDDPVSMFFDICAAISQDTCRGHYREKNSHPCNDAMEIQTLKQDDIL